MSRVLHSWRTISSPLRTCMKNLEHNQENIDICMKNIETNQANLGASLKNLETLMGQLAQSVREHPPKSFSSDTKTNPKQCMAVTLRSGKELEEPKKNSNVEQPENRKEEAEIEEMMEAKIEEGEAEVNNSGEKQKYDQVVPGRITFPNNPPVYTPPLPFP